MRWWKDCWRDTLENGGGLDDMLSRDSYTKKYSFQEGWTTEVIEGIWMRITISGLSSQYPNSGRQYTLTKDLLKEKCEKKRPI